jgi:hypothetical protein
MVVAAGSVRDRLRQDDRRPLHVAVAITPLGGMHNRRHYHRSDWPSGRDIASQRLVPRQHHEILRRAWPLSDSVDEIATLTRRQPAITEMVAKAHRHRRAR